MVIFFFYKFKEIKLIKNNLTKIETPEYYNNL